MNEKNLLKEIFKILDEKKATDIIVLDMRKLTTITDYFIIATANSTTHLKALAKEIFLTMKEKFNLIPLNSLNENEDKWMLIDYQDFIIHLFIKEAREFYNLEDLWFEAKRIKIKY
jgi:ribosome-associated protein